MFNEINELIEINNDNKFKNLLMFFIDFYFNNIFLFSNLCNKNKQKINYMLKCRSWLNNNLYISFEKEKLDDIEDVEQNNENIEEENAIDVDVDKKNDGEDE